MISALKYFVQERKGKLISYLNSNTDDLSLEKQHQIYGAIVELEHINELLNSQRKNEIDTESHPDEIFLFKPIHGQGFLKDTINFIKDLF